MSKCNIDTSWIKHIIMDDKGNIKDRVDGCLITILIHGVQFRNNGIVHIVLHLKIYTMNQ